jgi:hypothetical protein
MDDPFSHDWMPRGSAVDVEPRVYCIYRTLVKRILHKMGLFAVYSPVRRKDLKIGSIRRDDSGSSRWGRKRNPYCGGV